MVISNSPSNVPAAVQVSVGNTTEHSPAEAFVTVAVIVDKTVVLPTSRILSFTVSPVRLTTAHVSLFSGSNVWPLAAVLLSFKVNCSSGKVSPTTNLNVL